MAIVDQIERDIVSLGDAWRNPDWTLLQINQTAAPNLPIQVFGSWAGRLVDMAKSASAPVDYSAFALLAHTAALVGNAIEIAPDPEHSTGWTEPFALWVAIVGPPSSGKTPALKPFETQITKIEKQNTAAQEPLRRDNQTQILRAEKTLEQWEKAIEKAIKSKHEPPPMPDEAVVPDRLGLPQIRVIDTTIEKLASILKANPKGVLQYRDELWAWFESMTRYSGGSDRPQWLEMYQGGMLRIDRVKHETPIIVEKALASILGGIQPDRLEGLLTTPDDGLLSRFLFIWPDSVPLKRAKAHDADIALRTAFKHLNAIKLDAENLQPFRLCFSDEASDVFFRFRETNRQLANESSGLMASWVGKSDGFVARLAGLFTMLDWAEHGNAPLPSEVSTQTLQRAITLWTNYLLPMAERALAAGVDSEPVKHARHILQKTQKLGRRKIRNRDIYREWNIPGMNKSSAACDAALEELEGAGWIKKSADQQTGGRKEKAWDVNPKLWV